MTLVVGIRIEANGTQAQTALKAVSAEMEGLRARSEAAARSAAGLGGALGGGSAGIATAGRQAQLTTKQFQDLGLVLWDAYHMLRQGTSPFDVLVQKGPHAVAAVGGVAAALNLLRGAATAAWAVMAANPVGAIVTLAGVATAAFLAWRGATSSAADSQKLHAEAVAAASGVLGSATARSQAAAAAARAEAAEKVKLALAEEQLTLKSLEREKRGAAANLELERKASASSRNPGKRSASLAEAETNFANLDRAVEQSRARLAGLNEDLAGLSAKWVAGADAVEQFRTEMDPVAQAAAPVRAAIRNVEEALKAHHRAKAEGRESDLDVAKTLEELNTLREIEKQRVDDATAALNGNAKATEVVAIAGKSMQETLRDDALGFFNSQIEAGLDPQQRYAILVAESEKALEILAKDGAKPAKEQIDAFKKSIAEQNPLLQEGKRVTESMLTPQERFAAETERLNALLKANAITQETYNRALAKADPALQQNAKATEDAAAAQKKYAEELKNTADRVSGELAGAMLKDLTEGGDAVLDWFRQFFKKIALEALKTQIVLPIVAPIVRAVPGLFGIAGAAGGNGILSGQAAVAAAGPGVGSVNTAAGGLGLSGLLGFGSGQGAVFGGGLSNSLFGGTFFVEGMNAPMATHGLLGSGGTLFGSSSLAAGLGGALTGAGIGGLYTMLGLGRQGYGATVGGGIGGGLAALAGLGGPAGIALALAGSIVGGMFGPRPSIGPRGDATFNLSTGSQTRLTVDNGADPAQIASFANPVNASLQAFIRATGGSVAGSSTLFSIGQQAGRFHYQIGDQPMHLDHFRNRPGFESAEAAAAAAARDLVTQGFISGITDPNIRTALQNSTATTIEGLLGDVAFARGFADAVADMQNGLSIETAFRRQAKEAVDATIKSIQEFRDTTARLGLDTNAANAATRAFVERMLGISEAAQPLTEIQKALAALGAEAERWPELLKAVGYTEEQATQAADDAKARRRGEMVGDFKTGLDREYNELRGQGFRNQITDIRQARDTGTTDANALGRNDAERAELRGLVDRNANAALDRAISSAGLTREQLEALKTEYAGQADVVASINRVLAGTVTQSAETMKRLLELRQNWEDREFERGLRGLSETDQITRRMNRQGQREIAEARAAGATEADIARLTALLEGELADALAVVADRARAAVQALRDDWGDRRFELGLRGLSETEQITRRMNRQGQREIDAARAAGATEADIATLTALLGDELAAALAAVADRAREAVDALRSGWEDREFERGLRGLSESDQIERRMTRQGRREIDAAKAAGASAEDIARLSALLDGELADALAAVADRAREAVDALRDGWGDREFDLSLNGMSEEDRIRARAARQGQREIDAARAAGASEDDIARLSKLLQGELAVALKELADRGRQALEQLRGGLADREFEQSLRGLSEEEQLRRRNARGLEAELAAARAIGASEDDLRRIRDLWANDLSTALGDLATRSAEAARQIAEAAQQAAQATNADARVRANRLLGRNYRAGILEFDRGANDELSRALASGADVRGLLTVQEAERARLAFDLVQSDLLEAYDREIATRERAVAALEQETERRQALAKALLQAADGMLTDPGLTKLAPEALLNETRRQFEAAVTAKDDDRIMELGRMLVQAERSFFAGTRAIDFDRVQAVLRERATTLGVMPTAPGGVPLEVARSQLEEMRRAREQAAGLGQRQIASIEELSARLTDTYATLNQNLARLAPVAANDPGARNPVLSAVFRATPQSTAFPGVFSAPGLPADRLVDIATALGYRGRWGDGSHTAFVAANPGYAATLKQYVDLFLQASATGALGSIPGYAGGGRIGHIARIHRDEWLYVGPPAQAFTRDQMRGLAAGARAGAASDLTGLEGRLDNLVAEVRHLTRISAQGSAVVRDAVLEGKEDAALTRLAAERAAGRAAA